MEQPRLARRRARRSLAAGLGQIEAWIEMLRGFTDPGGDGAQA